MESSILSQQKKKHKTISLYKIVYVVSVDHIIKKELKRSEKLNKCNTIQTKWNKLNAIKQINK